MHSSKLFEPAIRIIGNIKYTRKIALAGFIFFLPVLLFLFLGYGYLGNQYRSIQKFQSGLHYNQAIRGFFEYILLERGMMAALGHGDSDYKRRIEANFTRIKAAIAAVDALVPPTLFAKKEWEKIKTEWTTLRQEIWDLPPQQSFDRHTVLGDNLLRLMENADIGPHVAGDVDLSLLHLAEILNEHIPALAQGTGKGRAIGVGVILKQSMSLEEKKTAIALYGAIQSHKAGIQHASQTGCNRYPDICRAISPSLSRMEQEVDSFSEMFISKVINADHWPLDPQSYFGGVTQTINYYFDAYNALWKALQKHLDYKLALLTKQIIAISIIAIVMLICLIYFMIGFYLSFIGTLKGLTEAAEMITRGNFDISIPVRTQDEMADVSYAFNEMSQKIKQTFAFLESYKKAIDESNIVSITDIEGNITYVNNRFCKITGYTRKELIGQNHRIFKDPSAPKKIYEELWKTILDKRVWSGILKNIDKNKKPFFIDSTITPIINAAGEIVEFIAIQHNITELIEKKEQLIHQLYTDSLTGLPNRIKLLEDLKHTRGAVLALVNIDRFSEINEFYGTHIGDGVLLQMHDYLISSLPSTTFKLYHIYADEFALLSKGDDAQDHCIDFLATLHKQIESHPFVVEGNNIIVNVTLGAIVNTNKTAQHLLIDADMVLRHAKRSQKDILILSKIDSIKKDIAHNIEYIGRIKEAIATGRIVPFFQKIVNNQMIDTTQAEPYYQPIIDNNSGAIAKHEALMRLITPEGTVISPFFFLNVAKKARLYTQLTRIMIEKVFAIFQDREDEFSINLSVDDIMDPATVKFILEKMEDPTISHRIIFEILESEGFENFEEVRRFIGEIKRRGGRIAIDDFGSGYSNFAYLIHLQVDFIKIDASLIKNIDKDPNSRIIVETIVTFAKLLGIKTIAEFVHSREVFEVVRKIGVDFSQGFYFYEPQSWPSQEGQNETL